MSEVTVSFSVNLNDGGKGHSETFTLEALGIEPDSLTEDELEEQVQQAYENWVWNFNMGGWGYD